MARDDRQILEEIASEMGAVAPGDMKDDELIAYVTMEEE